MARFGIAVPEKIQDDGSITYRYYRFRIREKSLLLIKGRRPQE